jgi:cytochrome P450
VENEAARRIANSDQIDVVDAYARPIAAHTATALFGISGPNDRTFMDVARAIFGHVFLNLSGDEKIRERAIRAGALMSAWFNNEISARRASGNLGVDMMGHLLRAGVLNDDGVRRTLGGMLVGSIDTTTSSVAKIIATILKDPALKRSVEADVDDETRLAGWCREALRRWPHNPIVLREAAAPTNLGDMQIKQGDRIFAWTQAAMLDAEVFPDPQHLRSDRPAAAYLHFGAGLHPCAGRAVNALSDSRARRSLGASWNEVGWADQMGRAISSAPDLEV